MEARILAHLVAQHEGETIALAGWVHARRDHGKIIFIDLRDRSGLVQAVFTPGDAELYALADSLRPEWVIQIRGTVKKRPAGMENPDIESGAHEVAGEALTLLSRSETPPFPLDDDGYSTSEELRLAYRYLDLRRSRLALNMRFRMDAQAAIREFLAARGFLEVETPILTKSTPEGARDFLVPSRMHPGAFYALPQSPQQYKQLLMIAGVERYFQFARCFRDEDLREDRMLEFTQLDIEMSFVDEEDILALTEELMIEVSRNFGKKIQDAPFPRFSAEEVMKKYNTDKPDLRRTKGDPDLLSYAWITDFPMFEKKEDGSIDSVHHPFTAIKDEDISRLDDPSRVLSVRAKQYDLVMNGSEIFGGSIRTHDPETLAKVFRILGHPQEKIERDFGHLLRAFRYGVPPHGGIAAGFDRWLQILLNEQSIREVVPFPTSGRGVTAVMEAPTEVDAAQLRELRIEVRKKKER